MWISQVEVPQNQAPSGLLRTRDRDMLSPRELLDQSGSNDFSAYKEIQELKDGGGMLRCAARSWVWIFLLWSAHNLQSFCASALCAPESVP